MAQGLRRIPFDRIGNFRDLGGYPTRNGGMTRYGRAFRCDGLHDLPQADKDGVLALGIAAIFDLRTDYEAMMHPDCFTPEDGVEEIRISPMEGLLDLSRATGASLHRLDMGELYINMLEQSKERWRALFSALALRCDRPFLFHCSAGKDRTGLMAMFLLYIAGCYEADIIADYETSHTYLTWRESAALREAFQGQIQSLPATIIAAIEHLNARYGGALAYLSAIGVTPVELEALARAMVQP